MNINLFHDTHFAMNTRLHAVMWGNEQDVQEQVFQQITNEIEALELLMSRFYPQSETYRLNKLAGEEEVRISSELWDILQTCLLFNTTTQGYFDVCYSTKNKEKHPLQLDSINQTVRFNTKDVQLDFGGIGKGLALKQIRFVLEEHDIRNALISFGESSVLAVGRHPHGEYWPFSFKDEYQITERLQLKNTSVSVSGLHHNNAHIFDPTLGQLSDNRNTICIQSENPVVAEVLSTALIAAPKDVHSTITESFEVQKIVYGFDHVLQD